MVQFGIELEDNQIVHNFIRETNIRFCTKDLIKNPFNNPKIIPIKNTNFYIVSMESIYPNVYLWGLVYIAIIGIVFRRFTWWLVPGIVLFSFGFFWSKYFIYLMLRKALHKHNYIGKIRLIQDKIVIRELINSII